MLLGLIKGIGEIIAGLTFMQAIGWISLIVLCVIFVIMFLTA